MCRGCPAWVGWEDAPQTYSSHHSAKLHHSSLSSLDHSYLSLSLSLRHHHHPCLSLPTLLSPRFTISSLLLLPLFITVILLQNRLLAAFQFMTLEVHLGFGGVICHDSSAFSMDLWWCTKRAVSGDSRARPSR